MGRQPRFGERQHWHTELRGAIEPARILLRGAYGKEWPRSTVRFREAVAGGSCRLFEGISASSGHFGRGVFGYQS